MTWLTSEWLDLRVNDLTYESMTWLTSQWLDLRVNDLYRHKLLTVYDIQACLICIIF